MDNPKKAPAFQFYPDNWFGSRHVSAMDLEQRGIHATLIFAAWLEENCGIPENEVHLCARIPEDKIPIGFQVISMCWFLYNGFYFNERLLNERIKQIKLSKLRTDIGSKGGRPSKSKSKKIKPIANQKDSKAKAKKTKSRIENEIEKEIEDRKKKFINEVNSYKDYLVPMLNDFIRYWTEINKSKTKMRFEMEKTWETSKRLATWANRSKEFNKSQHKSGADLLREMEERNK